MTNPIKAHQALIDGLKPGPQILEGSISAIDEDQLQRKRTDRRWRFGSMGKISYSSGVRTVRLQNPGAPHPPARFLSPIPHGGILDHPGSVPDGDVACCVRCVNYQKTLYGHRFSTNPYASSGAPKSIMVSDDPPMSVPRRRILIPPDAVGTDQYIFPSYASTANP